MEVLGIPSILKQVLRKLDTSFIAHTCRLVNSDWNYESCSILQERIPINFTTCDQLVKYCNTFETTTIEGTSIIFNSFRFSIDLFASAIHDRAFGALKRLNHALERFAKVCGEWVLNLEVTLYPIYPLENDVIRTSTVFMYEHLIKMIYSSFPNILNLKVLFLISNTQEVPEDFDIHTFMEPYTQIMLPNIERLTIEVAVHGEDGDVVEPQPRTGSENIIVTFMKAILSSAVHLKSFFSSNVPVGKEKILQDCVFHNILQISRALRDLTLLLLLRSDEDVQILCSKHFSNLQHLQLEIDSKNVTPEALRDVFTHCKSLQNLSLRFLDATHSSIVYPTLPLGVCMGHLNELCLEDYNVCLNYKYLPNLKNLAVKHCKLKGIFSSILIHHHNANVVSCGNEPICLSIRKLAIGTGCNIQTDNNGQIIISSPVDFVAKVIPCFAYLSSLKVSNFALPLPLIFKNCTNLRVLSVLKCDGVTDLVISGISRTLLEAMCPLDFGNMNVILTERDESKRTLSEKPELVEFINSLRGRSGFRESAFIGCLKGLHFLELEGEISDKGILYGVIHCERLKTLILHTNLISWRGQQIIQGTLKDILKFQVFDRRSN